MGLCRERIHERVEVILPIDQCDEYKDAVRSCLYSESGRKLTHNGQYNETNIISRNSKSNNPHDI